MTHETHKRFTAVNNQANVHNTKTTTTTNSNSNNDDATSQRKTQHCTHPVTTINMVRFTVTNTPKGSALSR